MKNLARMYRTGGTPPTPPKSEEMQNEEMMVGILNQPGTEAERKQAEADKKAPGMDADQPKKPKPPAKKAGGGSIYARGAKVGSASKRADGCAERGKTKGRFV
jgi:hypothetical protein